MDTTEQYSAALQNCFDTIERLRTKNNRLQAEIEQLQSDLELRNQTAMDIRVKWTELGMLGLSGLRAEITADGFKFVGEVDAHPGSVTYLKFKRVVDRLAGSQRE